MNFPRAILNVLPRTMLPFSLSLSDCGCRNFSGAISAGNRVIVSTVGPTRFSRNSASSGGIRINVVHDVCVCVCVCLGIFMKLDVTAQSGALSSSLYDAPIGPPKGESVIPGVLVTKAFDKKRQRGHTLSTVFI